MTHTYKNASDRLIIADNTFCLEELATGKWLYPGEFCNLCSQLFDLLQSALTQATTKINTSIINRCIQYDICGIIESKYIFNVDDAYIFQAVLMTYIQLMTGGQRKQWLVSLQRDQLVEISKKRLLIS